MLISFVKGLIPIIIFGITGFLFLSMFNFIRQQFKSFVDKAILGLFIGAGLFTLLFIIENAIFKIKIDSLSIYVTFIVICATLILYIVKKRIKIFDSVTRYDFIVLLILIAIFILALKVRLHNTLMYPDILLDADPYRHHVRARHIVATGMIPTWDPLIIGENPILRMQGCYVLAAIVSLLSGIRIWSIWKFLPIIMGSSSILAIYLLAKHIFKKDAVIGLVSAAFLAASPIHITRTQIGFNEPFGLAFLPLAILFFLLFINNRRYEFAILFGFFFTAMSANALIVGEFLAPLLLLYGIYILISEKQRRKIFIGFLIAFSIFAIFILIWSQTYLGVSLLNGLQSASKAGASIMESKGKTQASIKNVIRLLGLYPIMFALLGLFLQIFKPRISFKEKKCHAIFDFDLNRNNVFLLIFFLLYFDLAYLAIKGFPTFTGYYYRYYMLPSFCISILAALLIAKVLRWLLVSLEKGYSLLSIKSKLSKQVKKFKKLVPPLLYLILSISLFIFVFNAKPIGYWGLSATQKEYKAFKWIIKQLPLNSLIISNWFTGDFIRSLTGRRIIISSYLAPTNRYAIQKEKLDVPLLKTVDDMLKFAQERKKPVYLFIGKYGPFNDFENNPNFVKIFQEKEVYIFEVMKD